MGEVYSFVPKGNMQVHYKYVFGKQQLDLFIDNDIKNKGELKPKQKASLAKTYMETYGNLFLEDIDEIIDYIDFHLDNRGFKWE